MKVSELFKVAAKKGEIGIEIEAEFNIPLNWDETPPNWIATRDGSLRGESAEFIVRNPITRNGIEKTLNNIYNYIEPAGLKDSDNCSVHVHINCQTLTIPQAVTFAALYYIFEPALMPLCGEHRSGNLFCLTGLESQYQFTVLEQIALGNNRLRRDDIKYAAMNLFALKSYGSLEFRAMKFPISKDELSQWIKILLELKDSAMRFNSPVEILDKFSELGLPDFVATYLPSYSGILNIRDYEEDIRDVMHYIQPALYAELRAKPKRLFYPTYRLDGDLNHFETGELMEPHSNTYYKAIWEELESLPDRSEEAQQYIDRLKEYYYDDDKRSFREEYKMFIRAIGAGNV